MQSKSQKQMKALQAARQQLNKWIGYSKDIKLLHSVNTSQVLSLKDAEFLLQGNSFDSLVKRKIKHYENQIVILSQKLGLTHNSNI